MRPVESTPRKFGTIHPTALIGGEPQHFKDRYLVGEHAVQFGEGVKIGPFTTIDRGTERPTLVGDRTYVMGHCNIGHDVQIGADCEIADSVVIAGHATLEDGVRVGIGAQILPFKHVGAGARIGAGAVVTTDVPAGETWAGVPARPLVKKQPKKTSRAVAESR